MQDRSTQGFMAGVVGAIVQMFFTVTIYEMGFIRLRFMDYAGIVCWGHPPDNLLQSVIAELIVWMFCGALGVVFVQSLRVVSSKNIMLKGAAFGILYWLVINAFVTAFRVDGIYPIGFPTAVIHLLGGIVWGVVTTRTYVALAEKYGLSERGEVPKKVRVGAVPQPALKPWLRDDPNDE